MTTKTTQNPLTGATSLRDTSPVGLSSDKPSHELDDLRAQYQTARAGVLRQGVVASGGERGTRMLGKLGTEQFSVRVELDERQLSDLKIHDPFLTQTTVVRPSRFDLLRLLFSLKPKWTLRVKVSGTEGAMRAVMSLDPSALAAESARMLEERQSNKKLHGDAFQGVAEVRA